MIRTKNNLGVLRQLIYNLLGIGRSNHYIRQSLHFGTRIHITHYHVIRVLCFECRQIFRLAAVRQRATCIHIRNEHFLLRTENLHRLSHKMHAAHY